MSAGTAAFLAGMFGAMNIFARSLGGILSDEMCTPQRLNVTIAVGIANIFLIILRYLAIAQVEKSTQSACGHLT